GWRTDRLLGFGLSILTRYDALIADLRTSFAKDRAVAIHQDSASWATVELSSRCRNMLKRHLHQFASVSSFPPSMRRPGSWRCLARSVSSAFQDIAFKSS